MREAAKGIDVVNKIRSLKVEVICLIETRVRECNMKAIWSDYFADWIGFHNYQFSTIGRIWFFCRKDIKVALVDISLQSITCLLSVGSIEFFVTGIYGCNLGSGRLSLWQHLIDLKNTIGDKPWLAGVTSIL
ncbi:hypothetical protein V6N13_113050 [Hibiscus sabdariffa]|uniref:Uncharacterized protein n=1 Tax=Hibiscus sabdariffa TaxID=183260 RepID=A0ABR2CTG1_9ROSI